MPESTPSTGPSFRPSVQASTPAEQKRPVVNRLIEFFKGKPSLQGEDQKQLGIIRRTLSRFVRQQKYPEN